VTVKAAESKLTLLDPRIVAVTVIEAAGVYFWLRLNTHHPGWGRAALVAGECAETVLFMVAVDMRLRARWGGPAYGGSAGRHYRKLKWTIALTGIGELGIWLLWLRTDQELGLWPAAGVLLVLMHLKHTIESAAVCDVRFRTEALAPLGAVASGFEVAGAVGCLALIEDDHLVWAGVALFFGLLLEHMVQIGQLRLEVMSRDIRVPRDPRWRAASLGRVLKRHGLTHCPRFWRAVQRVERFERFVNKHAINGLLKGMEPRPNPLSTMAPYTSWASLTDRTFSGRHLPPGATVVTTPASTPDGPPSVADVAALFQRDGGMRECPKSTVLFAFFAQWLTDGFLRTARNLPDGTLRDTLKNESTHSIDLSQLYGLTPEVTRQLRANRGGLLKSQRIVGEEYPPYYCSSAAPKREFDKLLKPVGFDALSSLAKNQLFASGTDVTNMGVVAFNTLFLREHNEIARRLSRENPSWDDPSSSRPHATSSRSCCCASSSRSTSTTSRRAVSSFD
jgi:hypothetical protein